MQLLLIGVVALVLPMTLAESSLGHGDQPSRGLFGSSSDTTYTGLNKISDQFIDKRKNRDAPISDQVFSSRKIPVNAREDLTKFAPESRILEKTEDTREARTILATPGAVYVGEYTVEYGPARPVVPIAGRTLKDNPRFMTQGIQCSD